MWDPDGEFHTYSYRKVLEVCISGAGHVHTSIRVFYSPRCWMDSRRGYLSLFHFFCALQGVSFLQTGAAVCDIYSRLNTNLIPWLCCYEFDRYTLVHTLRTLQGCRDGRWKEYEEKGKKQGSTRATLAALGLQSLSFFFFFFSCHPGPVKRMQWHIPCVESAISALSQHSCNEAKRLLLVDPGGGIRSAIIRLVVVLLLLLLLLLLKNSKERNHACQLVDRLEYVRWHIAMRQGSVACLVVQNAPLTFHVLQRGQHDGLTWVVTSTSTIMDPI